MKLSNIQFYAIEKGERSSVFTMGGPKLSYQALYRVWRPQTFKDIVGQEHVTKTLQNALLQQKISHAYLFSGPRGTGKTTAAKVLAKAVNCLQAPVSEPCNQCDVCLGISDGSIADVIEIDAASNNGVEEIRDIRDKVKYAPNVAKYKVYIIDEVHMLSIGAFNALLKTLEEPPKHVIFILATTEPHKIPLTIISRCQRFDFKRITANKILDRMRTIIQDYQYEYDEEALEIIARSADGGMRDALSLLDQAISYSQGRLTLQDALVITGSISQQALQALAHSIQQKDASSAIKAVHSLLLEGKEPTRIVEECIQFYRDLLLYKTSPHLMEYFERITVNETTKQIADQIKKEEIYHIIDRLNQAQQEMKWTNHPTVLLEVCIIQLCQEPVSEDDAKIIEEVKKLQEKITHLEAELRLLKEKGLPSSPVNEPPVKNRTVQMPQKNGFKVPVGKIEAVLTNATKQNLHLIKSNWGAILDKLKKSYAALLNDAEPVAASMDACIIKFKYEIHCQMAMNNADFVAVMTNAFSSVVGHPLEMIGIPEKQWQDIRQTFIQQHQQGTKENAAQESDPLIEEAKKLVGEELLEIRE